MQLLSNLSSACIREPGVQYISAKYTVEAAVRVIATPTRRNREGGREGERKSEREREKSMESNREWRRESESSA